MQIKSLKNRLENLWVFFFEELNSNQHWKLLRTHFSHTFLCCKKKFIVVVENSAKNSKHISKNCLGAYFLRFFWDNNYGDNKAKRSESHIWSIFLSVFCSCSFSFAKLLFLGENEKLMNNVKLYQIDCRMMLFISSFARFASLSWNITKFRNRIFPYSIEKTEKMCKFLTLEAWKKFWIFFINIAWKHETREEKNYILLCGKTFAWNFKLIFHLFLMNLKLLGAVWTWCYVKYTVRFRKKGMYGGWNVITSGIINYYS